MSSPEESLAQIADWPIAATNDDRSLYFDAGHVTKLESGRRFLVVGRKGSGKSAICEHLLDRHPENSSRLSTTDFPWNVLKRLSDDGFPQVSRFVTVWRFVLLRSILDVLSDSKPAAAERVLKNQTVKAFFASIGLQPQQRISDTLGSIAQRSISIGHPNFGKASIGSQRAKKDMPASVADFNNVFQAELQRAIPDRFPIFLLFDGLDDNFNPHTTDEERADYLSLIDCLIRAADQLREEFRQSGKGVFPIIFLRSDLRDLLQTSNDANKREDHTIELNWSRDSLVKLVTHRLSRQLQLRSDDDDFDSVWTQVFSRKTIGAGQNNKKTKSMFDEYILDQTLLRPRDVVAYLRFSAAEGLRMGGEKIPVGAVRNAQHPYSTHFKREFENELSPVIPDIARAMRVFSLIGKKVFSFADLKKYLAVMEEQADVNLNGMTPLAFCKLLFEASVIGTHTTGKPLFRYESPSALFNSQSPIALHRGLHMEFNIKHA